MLIKKAGIKKPAKPSLHAFGCMLARSSLLLLILAATAFAEPSITVTQDPTSDRSYSFGDVLFLSAIGKTETPFTPLSLLDF